MGELAPLPAGRSLAPQNQPCPPPVGPAMPAGSAKLYCITHPCSLHSSSLGCAQWAASARRSRPTAGCAARRPCCLLRRAGRGAAVAAEEYSGERRSCRMGGASGSLCSTALTCRPRYSLLLLPNQPDSRLELCLSAAHPGLPRSACPKARCSQLTCTGTTGPWASREGRGPRQTPGRLQAVHRLPCPHSWQPLPCGAG